MDKEKQYYLINEKKEVDRILSGIDLDPYEMRRMCRLLCRYFYGTITTDPVDIRNIIFKWANRYHLRIKLSLKHLVKQEIEIYRPIYNGDPIYIKQEEIDDILSLSKKKSVRRGMLGMLCFAKVFAIDGVFDICIKDFTKWINVRKNTFYERTLREMLKINFIRDMEDPAKWKDGYITKCTRKLYINFETQNEAGEYVLWDDNIDGLFRQIDGFH